MIEYRVVWAARSNITFRGESDWNEWGGDDEMTEERVIDALTSGRVDCEGLREALEASGFEWEIETREAAT